MARLDAVIISPVQIIQFGTGRVIPRGERLVKDHRRVIVLGNFSEAFEEAGESAIAVIEKAMKGEKLAGMDVVVVCLKDSRHAITEVLARHLPPESFYPTSLHDNNSSHIVWSLLHRGEVLV